MQSKIPNQKSVPPPIIHHKRIEAQGVVAVGAFGYEAPVVEDFCGEFQAGGVLRRKACIPVCWFTVNWNFQI